MNIKSLNQSQESKQQVFHIYQAKSSLFFPTKIHKTAILVILLPAIEEVSLPQDNNSKKEIKNQFNIGISFPTHPP